MRQSEVDLRAEADMQNLLNSLGQRDEPSGKTSPAPVVGAQRPGRGFRARAAKCKHSRDRPQDQNRTLVRRQAQPLSRLEVTRCVHKSPTLAAPP